MASAINGVGFYGRYCLQTLGVAMNIIELAKQAGFERLGHTDNDWVCGPEDIEAFAKLVAAHEREACAKVCEPQEEHDDPLTAWKIATAIRAMGTT